MQSGSDQSNAPLHFESAVAAPLCLRSPKNALRQFGLRWQPRKHSGDTASSDNPRSLVRRISRSASAHRGPNAHHTLAVAREAPDRALTRAPTAKLADARDLSLEIQFANLSSDPRSWAIDLTRTRAVQSGSDQSNAPLRFESAVAAPLCRRSPKNALRQFGLRWQASSPQGCGKEIPLLLPVPHCCDDRFLPRPGGAANVTPQQRQVHRFAEEKFEFGAAVSTARVAFAEGANHKHRQATS